MMIQMWIVDDTYATVRNARFYNDYAPAFRSGRIDFLVIYFGDEDE